MIRLFIALLGILCLQMGHGGAQTGSGDSTRLALLLQSAKYQIKKPGEYKTDLDSAEAFIRQAQKINLSIKDRRYEGLIALTLSYLYEERKEPGKGKAYAERAIKLFSGGGKYYALLGDSYLQLSVFYSFHDKTARKMSNTLSKAALSYHMEADPEREPSELFNIGVTDYDGGQYDSADMVFRRVIDLHIAQPVTTYKYLADIAYKNGDLYLSLYDLLEGEKHIETSTPFFDVENYYYQLARTYMIIRQPDFSLVWAEKGAALSRTMGRLTSYYLYTTIIIEDLLQQDKAAEALHRLQDNIRVAAPDPKNLQQQVLVAHDLGGCYLALKQYEKAALAFARLDVLFTNYLKLAAWKSFDYYRDLIWHHSTMANFYLLTGNFGKAQSECKLIDAAVANMNKCPPTTLSTVFLLHFKIDSARGYYLPAIRRFETYKLIKDSIYNVANSRQISELNIQYVNEHKVKDIRLLKDQRDLQRAALQKGMVERNLILAVTSLLLIIASLAYGGYYQKRRSNRKWQVKQRELNCQNTALAHLLTYKEQLLGEKDQLLAVRERLMTEIHHRVKNSLHMITSLLESQAAYLRDTALAAIQKSLHRVQAISLIHQKLYLNSTITSVDMSLYLREMISYLRQSIVESENIHFQIDVEPIWLDVAQAVPVGLIVNEAITNSLKYAFPFDQRGLIKLSMIQRSDQNCVLCIADDGVGLSKDFDIEKGTFLGMTLIKNSSKSLDAFVRINSAPGTYIELIFKNELPPTSNS